MRLHTKIRIIFGVAIIFVTAFFILFFMFDRAMQEHNTKKRYMQSAFLIQQSPNSDIDEYLKENEFERIADSDLILKGATIMHERRMARGQIAILKDNNGRYLFIRSQNGNTLLRDTSRNNHLIYILIAYIISVLFLGLLYIWLTRSLMPLKVLEGQINQVAQGNLNIRTATTRSDEIGMIANTFDAALQKIDSLVSSRQLFLRTIMHELKTPIAKGRLLGEFIDKKSLAQSYEGVFERLELLLEEFQKIEQLLSLQYTIKQSEYQAQDLLDQAIELLIYEPEEIKEHIGIQADCKLILRTDFDLFSVALKNLISNAISYSTNHYASIGITKNSIIISNIGEALEPIDEYFSPFNPKANGSGLGLYIVKNILDMLGHTLSYRYSNGVNHFAIEV